MKAGASHGTVGSGGGTPLAGNEGKWFSTTGVTAVTGITEVTGITGITGITADRL